MRCPWATSLPLIWCITGALWLSGLNRDTVVIRQMSFPSPLRAKFKITVSGGAGKEARRDQVKGLACCVLIVPLPAIGTLFSVVSHLLLAKACIQPRNSFFPCHLSIYSAHLFVMETLILIIGHHETKS